jgi:LmbE family N-acetylglucosaminyl deacetylase
MKAPSRRVVWLAVTLVAVTVSAQRRASAGDEKPPLRVMVIGAHPDDADDSGGTMAKYVALGHQVQLVSVTNGDAGHFRMGGGPLAQRRAAEARCAGSVIGADYVVLDNHDGELMPTIENRRQIIRLIREFRPDLVFSPRPDDYHPDHRATAQLVRDAAYMVTVPNVVAETPHLAKNPVFLYVEDRFTKPVPFLPDVVVEIDDMVEKKVDMFHCHESQEYEWLPYNQGVLDQVPADAASRRAWLAARLEPEWKATADKFRDKLVALYGTDRGRKVVHAEAFEVSEYGSPMTGGEIKRLFPFF